MPVRAVPSRGAKVDPRSLVSEARKLYLQIVRDYEDSSYSKHYGLSKFWRDENLPLVQSIIREAGDSVEAVHRIQRTFLFSVNAADPVKERAVDWLLREQRREGSNIFAFPSDVQEPPFSPPENNVQVGDRRVNPNFLTALTIGNGIFERLDCTSKDPLVLELAGTFFKPWEALRLQPSAEGVLFLLGYMERLPHAGAHEFEQTDYYERLFPGLRTSERHKWREVRSLKYRGASEDQEDLPCDGVAVQSLSQMSRCVSGESATDSRRLLRLQSAALAGKGFGRHTEAGRFYARAEERVHCLCSLESAVEDRHRRLRNLEEVVEERTLRIKSLEEALEQKGRRIRNLDQALAEKDMRLRRMEERLEERDRRLRVLEERDG